MAQLPPVHGIVRGHRIDNERERPNSNARGYGRRWRNFRKHYLAEHPLCTDCEAKGLVEAATQVHHIKKIVDGGELLDPANLKATCARCHAAHHARERGNTY